MPTKRLLRALIIAEILVGIISIVVSLATEFLLPEPLKTFVDREGEGRLTTREIVMLVAAIPLINLLLLSSIGLFFFWRPARILYLIAMGYGLVLTPFFGPYVDAGWGTILEEIAVIISGVILALVYWSPLKQLYEKAHTPV